MPQGNILHKKVGKIFLGLISEYTNLKLIQDPACQEKPGVKQRIPLFCNIEKGRENEFCNVDMLVLKNNKIKIIVEIEESNVKPTQVCGKFLTSALAKYLIHRTVSKKPVEKDENVMFIQILDTSKLKERTKKIAQWKQLEAQINGFLPLGDSRINNYKILTSDELSELGHLIEEIAR